MLYDQRYFPPCQETVMLTEREIDDLIKEWKPEPLVPQLKVCPPFSKETTLSPFPVSPFFQKYQI